MVEVLGDAGRHARSAVSAASLPFGVAVEVEGIFRIKMSGPDLSFARIPLAHRGLHDAASGVIENSPGAFRAAVAAGYGLELDVQLSADGAAMVFHDYDLDRLTGANGPVRAKTAAEARDYFAQTCG